MQSYHKRVGLLIDELIDYKDQVTRLLEFMGEPDSNLIGIQNIKIYQGLIWKTTERIATFNEQMELITIYLKKIDCQEISNDENVLFDSTGSINSLDWNHMADFIEPLIQWLKNIIEYYSNK